MFPPFIFTQKATYVVAVKGLYQKIGQWFYFSLEVVRKVACCRQIQKAGSKGCYHLHIYFKYLKAKQSNDNAMSLKNSLH